MTSPIEPMSPGERPTEPGWYVASYKGGPPDVLYAGMYPHLPDVIQSFVIGSTGVCFLPDEGALDGFTFIARFYPDRIEAAGGER